MKRSRYISFLIVLVLAASLLAGCGESKTSKGTASTEVSSTEVSSTEASSTEASNKETYIGSYDIKDLMNEDMDTTDFVEPCTIACFLEMNDNDKTYELSTDMEEMKLNIDNYFLSLLANDGYEDDLGYTADDFSEEFYDSLLISEKGTYETNGDKITFKSDSGDSREATVKNNKITMSLSLGSGKAQDVTFKK